MRSRLWDATVGAVATVLAIAAASCGEDDGGASETLSPIITTTTTSTTVGPTTTFLRNYEVQPGDTLTGIAEAIGVPIADLMRANGITDPNSIQAGQVLELPLDALTGEPDGSASTSSSTPAP